MRKRPNIEMTFTDDFMKQKLKTVVKFVRSLFELISFIPASFSVAFDQCGLLFAASDVFELKIAALNAEMAVSKPEIASFVPETIVFSD